MVIIALIAVVAVLFALGCCRVSGDCSRKEERMRDDRWTPL